MRLPAPLRLPLLVAVAYAAAAAGGLLLGVGSHGATVAWPAAGLTLVLLLNHPYRDWPRILAAIGVVELAIDVAAGFPPLLVAGLVVTNLAEPVLGALLYRRLARGQAPPELGRPRDALRLGICAVVAPAVANVIAATAVVSAGMTDGTGVGPATVWLSFATADMLGIVTVAPLFLAISQRRARLSAEIVGMVAATVAAATVVFLFGNGLHMYVAALPMLWAAVRRGPFAASLTSIALVVTTAFL